MSDNKQTVLTDEEIQDIADGFDIYGARPEFARAIESAVLSKLRAAGEPVAWTNEAGDVEPISDAVKQARPDLYAKGYTRPLFYTAPEASAEAIAYANSLPEVRCPKCEMKSLSKCSSDCPVPDAYANRPAEDSAKGADVAPPRASTEALTASDVERQYDDGVHIGSGLPRTTCPCGFCKKHRYGFNQGDDCQQQEKATNERVQAMLLDPAVIHINMLRGTIAPITFDQLAHILGDEATAKWIAERQQRGGEVDVGECNFSDLIDAYTDAVLNGNFSERVAARAELMNSYRQQRGGDVLNVDALANEIRRVDGNHSLGAGELAEALMPFLQAHSATKGGSNG